MMNILIIRFSSLGDLVTLEPTFRAMRHFFKNDHITFLTSNIGKSLYEDTPYFDNFIVKKTFFQTITEFKDLSFDIVFNIQCTKPSHYLSFFINKKQNINKSSNLIQKIFNIKAPPKSIYSLLLEAHIDATLLNEYISHPEYDLIQFPIIKKPLFEDSKTIAISTGCSPRWKSKQWGVSNYEKLIAKLLEQNFKIILVGSKLEEDDAKVLCSRFPSIINYVNKTSLGELKNLLARVDLYVGNDSGPTHIAAAVGTNTLTIFGSTDIKHCPAFSNKYRGTHLYVKPNDSISCHPCYKTVCPTKHECMESIDINHVLKLIFQEMTNK